MLFRRLVEIDSLAMASGLLIDSCIDSLDPRGVSIDPDPYIIYPRSRSTLIRLLLLKSNG
jgi:hypothetical protein